MAVFSLQVEKMGNTISVHAHNSDRSGEIVVLVRLKRHVEFPPGQVGTAYIWLNRNIEPGQRVLVYTEELSGSGAGQKKVWVTGEYFEVEESVKSDPIIV
jgi:hypothetical protein